jgi:ferrous iron transport protein A
MSERLDAWKPREAGRVAGFAAGSRNYRQRLLAMGLTPGVEFQVIRVAPLGDPIEIRVRGASVSLRRGEAACLRVEKL